MRGKQKTSIQKRGRARTRRPTTSRGRSTSSSRSSSSTSRSPSREKRSSSRSRGKPSIEKLHHKSNYGIPNEPWRKLTSMSRKEREAAPEHCFLDPKNRRYPVCFKHGNEASCVGLQAAERRARLQHETSIVNKARAAQNRHGCNVRGGVWEERERHLYHDAHAQTGGGI